MAIAQGSPLVLEVPSSRVHNHMKTGASIGRYSQRLAVARPGTYKVVIAGAKACHPLMYSAALLPPLVAPKAYAAPTFPIDAA